MDLQELQNTSVCMRRLRLKSSTPPSGQHPSWFLSQAVTWCERRAEWLHSAFLLLFVSLSSQGSLLDTQWWRFWVWSRQGRSFSDLTDSTGNLHLYSRWLCMVLQEKSSLKRRLNKLLIGFHLLLTPQAACAGSHCGGYFKNRPLLLIWGDRFDSLFNFFFLLHVKNDILHLFASLKYR